MLEKYKWLIPKRRAKDLYQLIIDFIKKCNDDHVAAYGAMSAFFFLLSFFPFMIFFLTVTRFLPFTKTDIQNILTDLISFEKNSLIKEVINEVYHKTAASVFTISIIVALWSSSRGMYSIVKGLNVVFDIDDTRNYFVLRFFSTIYTLVFTCIIIVMLILWVFGNSLYGFIVGHFPFLATIAAVLIKRGSILTIVALVVLFIFIYQYVPVRTSSIVHQVPGAIVAALGWIATSKICALYMDNFSNFTYIYGSMTGITILLIWMYFCMSMIFYGAEVNYFLENKENYHTLIRIMRPNFREIRRQKELEMREAENKKKKQKPGENSEKTE